MPFSFLWNARKVGFLPCPSSNDCLNTCHISLNQSTTPLFSSYGTNILTMTTHNFEVDCKKIHDSLVGLNQLIPSLACLTQLQRQQMRETYKAVYGEDLITHFQRYEEDQFSSMKCSVLSLWILGPHDRDAVVAREALQQDETNFKPLVEIFAGRKSSHILLITQAYQKMFRKKLDQDIMNLDPPHPFQKVRLFRNFQIL